MGSASRTIVLAALLVAMGGFLGSPAMAQEGPEEARDVEISPQEQAWQEAQELFRQIPPQPQGQLALPNAPIRERYGAPPGKYAEVMPDVYVRVKGKRGRRMARFAKWNQGLDGDRLLVYMKEGYPFYRHFVSDTGLRTEVWTYRERGVSYIFSRDGRLLETRIF